MKKIVVLLIATFLLAITPQVFAGDNFHQGFHNELGREAARASVGVVTRVLSGDFNGDGCVGDCSYGAPSYNPRPRLLPPTGNAASWARNPRDRANYRAQDRIYGRAYSQWERQEREIGDAQGRLRAYRNLERNQNRVFYRHY